MESAPGKPDYVTRALGALDSALDTVHDTILRPIIIAGRAAAFGLVIAMAAVVLFIAALIGFVRLIDVYAFPTHVWATYFLLAFVFFVAGAVCWHFRAPVKARK